MGATTKYGIRYPELIDPADANFAMKRMAEDVESALGTVVVGELIGSGLVSAQPNWSISGRQATKTGRSLVAVFTATYTGANIAVNTATGNIANVAMATFVAPACPSIITGFVCPLLINGNADDGTHAVMALTLAGTLSITGTRTGLPYITTNSVIRFSGCWTLP